MTASQSDARVLVLDSYFDGVSHQSSGPYTIRIVDGIIESVEQGDLAASTPAMAEGAELLRARFAMPGLTEAHCHLFLKGEELDFGARKAHLKAPREHLLATARESLERSVQAGVTLIRDAGDIHGVNLEIRDELKRAKGPVPQFRCPGRALRKTKRYGSFMALEADGNDAAIRAAIDELAPEADDLKVLLTGIIDFENGMMKGAVQFDLDQTKLIAACAREHGLLTYAHCSGPEGLEIATNAGINSIEHGFFMEPRFLEVMAEKQIAWVPTVSPVYIQYERPELAGWDADTVGKLWAILENHFTHLALAQEMGVPIVAGSDAGSYGVPHGTALIDELIFHRRAGLSVDAVLASGTSTPRKLWGLPSAAIRSGNSADMITLGASPYDDFEQIRSVENVILGSARIACAEGAALTA